MATGLGVTETHSSAHGHTYRQLFFARYIDWFFTTPLLLLDLVLISGLDLGTTIILMGADVAMIVTGLFGALDGSHFKWGWFLAGCAFMVVILVGLLQHGRRAAFARSNEVGNLYAGLAGYLLVLWWAYPIVWLLSEGKGRISSDFEVLVYAILDIAAKILFSIVIFVKHPIIAEAANPAGAALDDPLLGGRGGGLEGV
jgi:bacteriorhodopsin